MNIFDTLNRNRSSGYLINVLHCPHPGILLIVILLAAVTYSLFILPFFTESKICVYYLEVK